MNKYLYRVMLWMALVGKNMGSILGWLFLILIIGAGLSLIGMMIGDSMKIPWREPILYTNLAAIIIALIIYGIHKWWQWGEDNFHRINGKMGEIWRMEEIIKKDAELLKIAQVGTQSTLMPPEKGFETDNTRIIASLSNQVEHYQTLARNLEDEKNAALKDVSKYKELYEKMLFSHKLVVDSLIKENEELKEQVARTSTNAIMDLE